MLLLGLTGSIATGKSTVSSILSQSPYSLPVIDADLLARKVVEPGTIGYAKIVNHFSSTTPDLLLPANDFGQDGPNGKGRPLNRPALGRRVFGDEPERRRDRAILNGIVHPAVRREMYKSLLLHYVQGHWAVVLDIPLLFESGLDLLCGTVMVVAVRDPEIQMRRLRERDAHLTAEDAKNRVLSQTDVRQKARRAEARGSGAGVVIWNDVGREELRVEIARQMGLVKRKSPSWWRWLLLLIPPFAGVIALWNLLRSWLASRRWRQANEQERTIRSDSFGKPKLA
ncbi:MAG: hypothetical protein M1837_004728 [Sclerophora amabilis]|nr:MAG: hypothetical protein M1837_004728 [Sclerophora amabilis]